MSHEEQAEYDTRTARPVPLPADDAEAEAVSISRPVAELGRGDSHIFWPIGHIDDNAYEAWNDLAWSISARLAEHIIDPAAAATIERAAALLALADLPEGWTLIIDHDRHGGRCVAIEFPNGIEPYVFIGPRAIEEAAAWLRVVGCKSI